jgi:hypothetical protein
LSDPLSQFRKAETPARTARATTGNQAGKRSYEAYDTSGKPCPYTEIRCLLQPSQAPQSRFLMAVVFSSDYDEAMTLIYSFLAVEIKGKNLKEIRRAIQNGRCEFIQEFHANEFVPPAKGEPVIESIRFITGEKLDDILATYKAGK